MLNSPIPIVSSSFCSPESKDLRITKNLGKQIRDVNDENGNLVFKIQFSRKKTIFDAAGLPILTLRRKKFNSMHGRWEVFRGESTDDTNLVFSVRRSSIFPGGNKVLVFLANNKSEDACDYTIQESYSRKSYKIYIGDSSTIVAQMEKKTSIVSKFRGKDRFMVKVYPNIDQAFVVALIAIVSLPKAKAQGGGGGGGGGTMHTGGGGAMMDGD